MNANKRTPKFSLKDQLFNEERVEYLSRLFQNSDSHFAAERFVKEVMARLPQLELKERIVHIAATLENYLHADFRTAARQITNALPAPLDPEKTDNDFGDFIFAPLGVYVVRNGMEKNQIKRSLATLKAITQRFSMEDAIRSFINEFPAETLSELEKWSTDKNYHVRRLVSEGTRPLLPWSKRITVDSNIAIPLLDTLHSDSTRYVTRSVANHLNDISKSNPELVLSILQRWDNENRQTATERHWMKMHALRTLLKQGHPQAMVFLGFNKKTKIEVTNFEMTPSSLKRGEAFEFSFSLSSLRDESLMIDYVIEFVKANGSSAAKVYKLKQLNLRRGETALVKKRHKLHANATTYTLYPGTHHVTLQINGQPFNRGSFELR